MSEPDPQTWTAATSDPDNMNAEIRDVFQWLLGHSDNPKPHLRIRGSSPTTLAAPVPPDGTWTEIVFDTEVINRGFATSIPATIPIDGTYDLGCAVDVDFAVSNKAVRILKNGNPIGEDDQPGAGASVPMRITCDIGVLPLEAGDVITVECYNDAGISSTPATVDSVVSGESAPVLWIEYIATAN